MSSEDVQCADLSAGEQIMSDLQELKMQNDDFDGYANTFLSLNQQLRAINEPLTLNWQKFFLFRGLDGRAEQAKIDSHRQSIGIYQILADLQLIYVKVKRLTVDQTADPTAEPTIAQSTVLNADDKPSATIDASEQKQDANEQDQKEKKRKAEKSAGQSASKRSTQRGNSKLDADVCSSAKESDESMEAAANSIDATQNPQRLADVPAVGTRSSGRTAAKGLAKQASAEPGKETQKTPKKKPFYMEEWGDVIYEQYCPRNTVSSRGRKIKLKGSPV